MKRLKYRKNNMYNCFICGNYHDINKDQCIKFIKNMIINCKKKYNIYIFLEELEYYKKKLRYYCNICGRYFIESRNLKNHNKKNVCLKSLKYKCQKERNKVEKKQPCNQRE